jgi:anti-anti-sigma factor
MSTATSPLAHRRRLAVTAVGAATVIRFTSPTLLEEGLIRDISQELSGLVGDPARRHFVLTFAGVTRMCSALLAVLLAFHRKVERCGGQMVLCAVAPDLARWFMTTQLDKVLHMAASEPDALRALEPFDR